MGDRAADPAHCPLCGSDNACALAGSGDGAEPCWCTRVAIAPATLDRIPPAWRGIACICAACAAAEQPGAPPPPSAAAAT